MRGISIHYLKKTPLLFSIIKKLYIWSNRLYDYFTKYWNIREYRVIHYRKLIDGHLNSKVKIDYKKIAVKIEKEIHKRTKFELKLTSKWWLLFFVLINSSNKSVDINILLDDLLNETLCLPFSQNSSVVLLELYAITLEYRLYSVGCIIRCQAARRVLEEGFSNKSSQNIIERYLSAAFEEGENAELQDSLEKLVAINKNNEGIFLLNLLLHKIIINKSNNKLTQDKYIDRNFLEIIKGERVAIVGPAPSSLMSGEEIDTFDVIIRFNYKGESLSTNYYGSRTDISYLNGANSKDVEKNYKELNIRNLKAAVYKIKVEENMLISKCNRQMRLPLEHFTLDSSPFALPNVLADLLLYEPLEIKVFSCDMCLTNTRDISYGMQDKSWWNEYYPKAEHDPYSTYLFIEYLYSNNFISVDSKLNNILNLGIVEYMKKLQEIYFDKSTLTKKSLPPKMNNLRNKKN